MSNDIFSVLPVMLPSEALQYNLSLLQGEFLLFLPENYQTITVVLALIVEKQLRVGGSEIRCIFNKEHGPKRFL